LLDTTGKYHVKRIYYFNYFPGEATTTDRGLLKTGANVNTSPRPAYNVIKDITCPNSPCARASSADAFEASAQVVESEPDNSEPELPTEEETVRESFTTDEEEVSEDPLPEVETEAATEVQPTTLTFRGLVSPNEQASTYYFEFGPTEQYGMKSPVLPVSGSEEVFESAGIANLIPGTTYHYRIVAEGANGRVEGADIGVTLPIYSHPVPMRDPSTNAQWVYYQGSDGGIWELWRNPSTGVWANTRFPTAQAAPGSSPAIGRNATSGAQWLYYQGSDGGIWELYRNPSTGSWSNSRFPNTQAAPGSSPEVMGDPSTGAAWVYYQGSDGGIWELWRNPSTGVWANTRFPTAQAAPGSSPAKCCRSGSQPGRVRRPRLHVPVKRSWQIAMAR
jgi:hypothetical protein